MKGIKLDCLQRDKKLIDLAEALPMNYSTLVKIVNNYQATPPDFDSKCRKVFAQWDANTETAGKAA